MKNRIDDNTQVSDKENDIFTTMLSVEVFWEVIKANLMATFYDFYKGDLPLYNLNY